MTGSRYRSLGLLVLLQQRACSQRAALEAPVPRCLRRSGGPQGLPNTAFGAIGYPAVAHLLPQNVESILDTNSNKQS
jgi:hypothetical protein